MFSGPPLAMDRYRASLVGDRYQSTAAIYRVEQSLIGKPFTYLTWQKCQRMNSARASPGVSEFGRYLLRHC